MMVPYGKFCVVSMKCGIIMPCSEHAGHLEEQDSIEDKLHPNATQKQEILQQGRDNSRV